MNASLLLKLVIQEFEPPYLQDQLNMVLNSLNELLLEGNVTRCEVKYTLYPEELQSESSSSFEEENWI